MRHLRRAERRQLRKAIGRKLGKEWRVFGHQTRRWAYIGWEPIHQTWESVSTANHPTYREAFVSRANRWHRREPIRPVSDIPWDALNREIAERARAVGHAAQMRGKA